jgi:hypothetical protein
MGLTASILSAARRNFEVSAGIALARQYNDNTSRVQAASEAFVKHCSGEVAEAAIAAALQRATAKVAGNAEGAVEVNGLALAPARKLLASDAWAAYTTGVRTAAAKSAATFSKAGPPAWACACLQLPDCMPEGFVLAPKLSLPPPAASAVKPASTLLDDPEPVGAAAPDTIACAGAGKGSSTGAGAMRAPAHPAGGSPLRAESFFSLPAPYATAEAAAALQRLVTAFSPLVDRAAAELAGVVAAKEVEIAAAAAKAAETKRAEAEACAAREAKARADADRAAAQQKREAEEQARLAAEARAAQNAAEAAAERARQEAAAEAERARRAAAEAEERYRREAAATAAKAEEDRRLMYYLMASRAPSPAPAPAPVVYLGSYGGSGSSSGGSSRGGGGDTFYKGGQFLPGGGRAPKGGCYR